MSYRFKIRTGPHGLVSDPASTFDDWVLLPGEFGKPGTERVTRGFNDGDRSAFSAIRARVLAAAELECDGLAPSYRDLAVAFRTSLKYALQAVGRDEEYAASVGSVILTASKAGEPVTEAQQVDGILGGFIVDREGRVLTHRRHRSALAFWLPVH